MLPDAPGGNAEVGEDGMARAADEDVAGLQVPVDDVLPMQVAAREGSDWIASVLHLPALSASRTRRPGQPLAVCVWALFKASCEYRDCNC